MNAYLFQTLGPCVIDSSAPDFSGQIKVQLMSDHLVTTWSADSFIDEQEYYHLKYTFAIGIYCIYLIFNKLIKITLI